ncbi:unnamed protein product [Clonostachys rhizophaga]|uniref:Arrestin-like N-terminal domain-containing protein n=1 Tax=Clonostachys rhizophaga TaxID=160324 RepID=A0A9N9VY82_9HYPO|nr:unnamed protein product [Clonostachys rhizophaga]
MPQTQEKCGPALGIELDGDRTLYWPGDIITGHVYRQAPTVCPTAIVRITLHGRAKAKSVVTGYQNSEFRGEFTLIDGPKTMKTLFSGPIHIAADGGAQDKWPFSVPISPRVEIGGDRYCTESFLSIEPSSVAQDELPPSFEVTWKSGFDEAFVEYYLEASLRLDAKGSSITSNNLKRHDTELTVSSFHLEPSLKNAKLSRSQKVKKVFGTPSVPSLTFKVESIKNLRDVPQALQLKSLHINIWTIVEVKTEQRRPVGGGEVGCLDTNKALKSLSSPIELEYTNDSPTIDVGKMFKLGIPLYFTRPADSLWDEFVRPGVVAYNIRITNQLRWEMEFKIAGEIAKVDGKGDLEVLWPPREAFLRPPIGIPAGSDQS